jgi:hypothetical protein
MGMDFKGPRFDEQLFLVFPHNSRIDTPPVIGGNWAILFSP